MFDRTVRRGVRRLPASIAPLALSASLANAFPAAVVSNNQTTP
jgi:hypothetical protein